MRNNILRVILADEHRLFIDSLKAVIERLAPHIRVVGTAQNGIEAVKKAEKEQPDIIIMDINLPGTEGFEAIELIRNKAPDTKILILTAGDKPHCVEKAVKNRVSGYILKNIPLTELITLIPLINGKTTVLSNELVSGLFEGPRRSASSRGKKADSLPAVFSSREKSILSLVVQGFSNSEIAERVFLAEQTVKNYITIIYSKLGVHNRSQAMRMAMRMGKAALSSK
jgi:DNA-binding NarL/FixJ family response regulator